MITERREDYDESLDSVRQREVDAECVEDGISIGDGGKQPVKVILIDALQEGGDDFEKPPGVVTVTEHEESRANPPPSSFRGGPRPTNRQYGQG